MKNKITVFALSSSVELAQDICDNLGCEMGKSKVHHFADGEILVEIDESVRGKDVFIVQSTSNPVTAGVNRVVTIDLHAAQIQGFFNIPVDDMQALPLICNYFKNKNLDDICVVSPDHGGATRARKMAVALDCPVAIIDKRRPKPNVAEIMGVLGDVEGKNCIMIDDMIDTGGTIVAGIDMLLEKGAKNVFVACTHPVFSGPAVERLKNCSAKEVVVTDTIILPKEKHFDKLKVVSVASLLAKTIESIENNLPVSDVFQEFDFEK